MSTRTINALLLVGAWANLLTVAQAPIVERARDAAREASIREDWTACVRHARDYREALPQRALGWAMEGFCLDRAGRTAESQLAFEEALRRNPHQADALYHLADAAHRQGDWSTAAGLLARIRPPVPPNLTHSYHYLAGVLEVRQGGPPELAIGHFEQAGPLDPATTLLQALAYMRGGRRDDALPLLDGICTLPTDLSPAVGWLLCVDNPECPSAPDFAREQLEILDRLIALEPHDVDDLRANAARIHLRHDLCPADLEGQVAELARRRPDACRTHLLLGLVRSCAPSSADRSRACEEYAAAAECARSGGDTTWPVWTGPLEESGGTVDLGEGELPATASGLGYALGCDR